MDLNPTLVEEIEAYFARNSGRDPKTVKNEVFEMLNAVYIRHEYHAGTFRPSTGWTAHGPVSLPDGSCNATQDSATLAA